MKQPQKLKPLGKLILENDAAYDTAVKEIQKN